MELKVDGRMGGAILSQAPHALTMDKKNDIQLLRVDSRFAEVLAASRDGAARIARILEAARARGELPSYLEQPLDELKRLLAAPPS